MDQRGDCASLEGVDDVVVPVDALARQGNEQRIGRRLPRVDDDPGDALLRDFTLRAVSG
jgi:hypothetical protein